MTTENTKLMQMARESLNGKWGIAIGGFLIYTIIISIASYASLIIAGPFYLGICLFALNISRGKEFKIEQIFKGFNYFVNALLAYLLVFVYVFLWSLLLIVPGIIKGLSFSMVFFILADDPELNYSEALKQSEEMMDGHKWKFFKLNLRFLGWAILCLLTLGIGFLWLIPYMYVTYAKFYDDLKIDPLQEIGESI
ncbi:DUF975 family protein [Wenyingzhuangia sp. 2_MG-2023]|uniref:DUF975 family protein n=1 Tax=Wenyingzhuangia sp. 2_MG-2023 TaxID=3062639 RepID=UPI0026E13830|nr:DUF975 family protein [Wenyingzhuangia sp. 2_MG-2023]MDO6737946.1 DUF975 family protein [Wenyingzhuangia sp. 2_MG-2023]MDO6802700.1 DUF975 family protein [Wenyingzhuangia sp. 1_MG-2023]